MKDLKQAAEDYAEVTEVFDSVDGKLIEEAFLKGAEFVNTWISVKDELPPIGTVILLKFDNDYTCISTGIYDGNEFKDDFGFDEEICTHWRYIYKLNNYKTIKNIIYHNYGNSII